MTIGQWLSFQGRIGRKTFWLGYMLPLTVAGIIAGIIDGVLNLLLAGDTMPPDDQQIAPISAIVSLLLIWPWLAGAIKRLHDRNRSAWWYAGAYMPAIAAVVALRASNDALVIVLFAALFLSVYGTWLFVETGFLRGTTGPNRYGPDPLGGNGPPQMPQAPLNQWGGGSVPPVRRD